MEGVQFAFLSIAVPWAGSGRSCHPLWNHYRHEASTAGLLGVLLNCSAITNYGHGPYLSGKRFVTFKLTADKICRLAPEGPSLAGLSPIAKQFTVKATTYPL